MGSCGGDCKDWTDGGEWVEMERVREQGDIQMMMKEMCDDI